MPEPTRRHDPPSRPVDGAFTEQAKIRNTDPERVYCLANPNDFDTGVAEMQRLGWVIETHRKDGPRVMGGETAKDGDTLTLGGQLLMSRSRAAQEAYEKEKAAVAALRSASIGQRGGVDGLVGPTGRPAEFNRDPREYIVRD